MILKNEEPTILVALYEKRNYFHKKVFTLGNWQKFACSTQRSLPLVVSISRVYTQWKLFCLKRIGIVHLYKNGIAKIPVLIAQNYFDALYYTVSEA